MIVITKVEYMETPEEDLETFNLARIYKQQPLLSNGHPKVNYEYVYGETFIDTAGNRITIGMVEEVSEILKMPFVIIRRQQEIITAGEIDVRRYHRTLNEMEEMEVKYREVCRQLCYKVGVKEETEIELQKYKSMSFWNRLKFLFKGKKWNF